jgi:hypothetical protein
MNIRKLSFFTTILSGICLFIIGCFILVYINVGPTKTNIQNNNDNIKKERQIVDEVNANNEYIKSMLDLMFDLRVQFCKEVNEKFGKNIKVTKKEVEKNGIGNNDTRNDN